MNRSPSPAATRALKVLIADDHRLMLAALRRALRGEEDIEIVAETSAGADVLPLVREARPDVVLLDVQMPDLDGLACLALLRRAFPEVAVVMLSAATGRRAVAGALEGGARGYVAKTVTPEDLAGVIRRARSSAEFVTLGVPAESPSGAGVDALTGREAIVLEALARGLTNRQIAGELWVTEQTVKFHLRNIYRKLDVSTRVDAVRLTYGDRAAPVR